LGGNLLVALALAAQSAPEVPTTARQLAAVTLAQVRSVSESIQQILRVVPASPNLTGTSARPIHPRCSIVNRQATLWLFILWSRTNPKRRLFQTQMRHFA